MFCFVSFLFCYGIKCNTFLTACSFLVRSILAILLPVAQLHLGDATGRACRAAAGTQELVVRAGDGRTVGLVRPIGAIMVAIAMESGRDTQRVGAAELTDMARWEVWNINSHVKNRDLEVMMVIVACLNLL